MKKSIVILLASLVLIASLAACSVVQAVSPAIANAAQNGGSTDPRAQFSDPSKMTLEMKLAIGVLKLEGTDKAITVDQAKALLPLWQTLKSLSTSDNLAQDEINALYTQIEEVLTPDQIQAIKTLTWTQDDMNTLRTTYGIQGGFLRGPNGGPTLSADQRATRRAQFQANGGGAGGGPGGGGPPDGGGFGGGFSQNGGATQNRQGTPQAARTPSPAQLNRRAMGFNGIFADAVIKVLQERTK